uniref:TraR/DksA C4-type zinc finger protein n=1 Tax=Halomonas sp. TaxID=1486246 RepID=UPI00262BA857|nr:TraR/DksA C4-type zinc finger protein [Halomonas sp.]
MADIADIASELMERRMESAMATCRLPDTMAANDECEECGSEIPAARRQAAPWATTCIECQGIREKKAGRYRHA